MERFAQLCMLVGVLVGSCSAGTPTCSPNFACCGKIPEALSCMDDLLTIPSSDASLFAKSQANFVDNYYVFSPIAKNPGSIPQTNKFNLDVFTGKVDLEGGLLDIAADYASQTGNVSFARLLAKSNDLFIGTRDSHLRQFLPDGTSPLRGYYVFLSNSDTAFDWVGFRMYGNGTNPIMKMTAKNGFTSKTVATIDGMAPLDWVQNVTDTNVVPQFGQIGDNGPKTDIGNGYKGRGNSIANLLIHAGEAGKGLAFWAGQSGDLTRLNTDKMKVVFSDGTTTELVWFVFGINTQIPFKPVAAIQALNDAIAALKTPSSGEGRRLHADDASPPSFGPKARNLGEEGKEEFMSTHCPTGSDYCVIKMTSFAMSDIPPKEYVTKFNSVARTATQRGITKLIFDLNANGGGTIPLGYLAAHSLMPTVPSEQICDKFSEKLGPLYQFLADKKWYGKHLGDFLGANVKDLNATRAYAKNLAMDNCNGLKTMIGNVYRVLGALDILLEKGGSGTESVFTLVTAQDIATLKKIAALTPNAVSACEAGRIEAPPNAKSEDFYLAKWMWEANVELSRIAVLLALKDDLDNVRSITVDGVAYNYTVPANNLCHDQFFNKSSQLPPSPFGLLPSLVDTPFTSILAISDGMCGSTCGFFGLTALFHSLSDPSLPKFRFVVHGGLGTSPREQILTPTVFQGGNVMESNVDLGAQMWAFYALMESVRLMSNVSLPNLDELGRLIPLFQVYSSFPQYTFRMGYSNVLGEDALPTEYYLPLDSHYLPKWYYDYGINGAGLSKMYDDAAAFFSSSDPTTAAPVTTTAAAVSAGVQTGLGALLMLLSVACHAWL